MQTNQVNKGPAGRKKEGGCGEREGGMVLADGEACEEYVHEKGRLMGKHVRSMSMKK